MGSIEGPVYEVACGLDMQLRPRPSFSWTGRCCCCGSRTSSLLIFLVYIVLHITLLSISSLILHNPNEVLDLIIGVIDTRDRILADSDIYHEFLETILLVGVI